MRGMVAWGVVRYGCTVWLEALYEGGGLIGGSV